MLMSYALERRAAHPHGMDALSKRCSGTADPDQGADRHRQEGADHLRPRRHSTRPRAYAAEDADITLRLHRAPESRSCTASPGDPSTRRLERPLVPVLADMEMRRHHGGPRHALAHVQRELRRSMAGLEDEIHELAGEKFNVGSPKQLGEILFEQDGPGRRQEDGKTGVFRPAPTCWRISPRSGHDLPGRVLDWRQLSKLKGPIPTRCRATSTPRPAGCTPPISLAATTTGRLASTDPNLQNIPIRTEEGRRIREAFVAEPGKVLVSLDYSARSSCASSPISPTSPR
jgi:DNA polymerase-1